MARVARLSPLLALLALCGCGEEWGPTPKDRVDVQGRVRVGTHPVSGGWVQFIPIDGAVGDVRSARLRPDGTFKATKVARGRNAMRVVYPPARLAIDRLFQQFYTPVRPWIDGNSSLDIDLLREALRARDSAT